MIQRIKPTDFCSLAGLRVHDVLPVPLGPQSKLSRDLHMSNELTAEQDSSLLLT